MHKQMFNSWNDYENFNENKDLFRKLLNAIHLRRKYMRYGTVSKFSRYYYHNGVFYLVEDDVEKEKGDDINAFLNDYTTEKEQLFLSHTNLSAQIDSLSINTNVNVKDSSRHKNEIFKIPRHDDKNQKVLKPIPIEEYYSDCTYVLNVCNNRPIKSLSYRRLEHLKHSFNMYRNISAFKEKEEQQKKSRRDFYTVYKVDNHIHHSAAINCKHLLKFIKRKIKFNSDDVVYKKDGKTYTLREVFKHLNITVDELRIENIDTHSHTDTFHRFDRFNNKYNLLGQSLLREIFLKYDNFIDGRYLAELTKELINYYKENKYQNVELRISVYGKSKDEFYKLAHWIESNKLYSKHIKWVVQIPRLFPNLKEKYNIKSFGEMLQNIFDPLFKATEFADEKGKAFVCNKAYDDRYKGIAKMCTYRNLNNGAKTEHDKIQLSATNVSINNKDGTDEKKVSRKEEEYNKSLNNTHDPDMKITDYDGYMKRNREEKNTSNEAKNVNKAGNSCQHPIYSPNKERNTTFKGNCECHCLKNDSHILDRVDGIHGSCNTRNQPLTCLPEEKLQNSEKATTSSSIANFNGNNECICSLESINELKKNEKLEKEQKECSSKTNNEKYKMSLICNFLRNLGGFDTVDDESMRERKYHQKFPSPDEWIHSENPPYSYYIYFLYTNIKMLNDFRRSKKLNTFKFIPHSGETGDYEHLVNTFLTADSICHGVQLRKCFPLTYLFYACQIGVTMSPLSNNSLFIALEKNPFINFFNIGLNLSLSTDDPLHFHFTRDPLMEEYSVISQLYKLSSVDQCELARNSVIQSNFSFEWKKEVIGNFYKEGVEGNDIIKTNVPDIRIHYRWIMLCKERELIGYVITKRLGDI
ncbi:Adenosine monophosphate deaminase [Trachipleistophora hominis]|uniref:AMP deaminase n=1 Tax=Trachipleistophora hominis TaxID=72359 RepID=L7JTG7_TRAHO|nr:Adenosine monophosphate deaminase [Trachipleistophora hominis]